jgi:hypothetical protein
MVTMKSLLSIFVGSLLLISSDKSSAGAPDSASPTAASSPVVANASITADPNPVPAGDGPGKTTVNWQTTDGTIGEVYVSKDGAAETLFARGARGPAPAPWIVIDSTYEFRLYSGTDHKTVLARTIVTRAKH